MGSTNLNAGTEVSRRVAAREVLSAALPISMDTSRTGVTGRRSGLALSGRTTTARGHVIVPATKAKIIAIEYEHVPNDVKGDGIPSEIDVAPTSRSGRTISLVASVDNSANDIDTRAAENSSISSSPKTSRMTVNLGRNERYRQSTSASDGSRRVNNANKTLSTEVDRSTVSRESRIDRNHRSVTSASELGTVTAARSEVPPHLAALRQEYTVKKQNRIAADINNTQSSAQRGVARASETGQGRTRRRRGRVGTQSNEQLESSHKQNSLNRKTATGFNALGNSSNARRKYSPYLPMYIQPVIEENSAYRSQSNHMLYHSQSSSYAAQRSRKISTDMNRYESSPSSSSSSESEQGSPNRPAAANPIVERALPSRNIAPETPDTSDTENKPTGGRRRRRRPRTGVGIRPEISQERLNNKNKGEVSSRERIRSRQHGRISKDPQNVIPLLDDKYVTLPDNYKQSVFSGVKPAADGDAGQVIETANSQDAQVRGRSNEGNKSLQSERNARRDRDSRTVAKSQGSEESGISTGIPESGDKASSRSKSNQLIISRDPRLRGETLAVPPHDVSLSEEHLVPESNSSERIDFSVSTPDLDNPRRTSSRLQSAEGKISNGVSRGGIQRRNSLGGGESKSLGYIRSKFEKDAPTEDVGATFLKSDNFSQGITQRRTSRGSLHDVHEDAVIQRQPKIQARKVSEDFWPRDEATERLLSHSRAAPTAPSIHASHTNDYNTASRTMQETIDQLHEFANENTPLKSRSNSATTLNDYSKSYESERSTSADLGTQSESHRVGRKGSNSRAAAINLSRVQVKKISPTDVSSPCMSSTETLKECSSSGEYQDKNSRSPSIDSTASNPEIITGNVNDRMHAKVVYGRSMPIHNKVEELFIAEERPEKLPPDQGQDKVLKSDTSSANTNKSVLEVLNNLNDALKRSWKPQQMPSTQLQKASVRVDTLMNVSPKGNVTCHPPRLETLSEDPEPPSPGLKRKGKEPPVPKASLKERKDSLEIDEGIVTEEDVNEDPKSFLKLDEYLKESDRRNKRQPQTKDMVDGSSNGNESVRSLSDPSADRKRPQQSGSSVDSNLLGALQTGKKEDMGSFDHASCSSSSQFSEHPSSYSDTLNIEELISEEPISEEADDTTKTQNKSLKKKSKSDPNPEGYTVTEVISDDGRGGLHSASSEPNVTEEGDKLGELDQFQLYAKAKPQTMQEKSPGKLQPVQEPIFHAHVSPRISRPLSKKRINRMKVEHNSIIGRLMDEKTAQDYNEDAQGYNNNNCKSSSTSSPLASEESSPVQKEGPEALFQETEEQFMKVFDSMKSNNGSTAAHATPTAHWRTRSEPVQMGEVPRVGHASPTTKYQGRRTGMIQAPSLDSVGIRYSTAETASLHSGIHEAPSYGQDDAVFPPKEPYNQGKGKKVHDMRLHAFNNLLETEGSYVNSLKILYEDYMTPLKHPENHSTCEPRLVDEMFYKIPQLIEHHEKFYENVQRCYEDWNYREVRLGELFLNSFNKDALLDTYTAYITNYLNAREAVRTAEAKEAFKRFVEQCRSENKDKQGLADLMIKPVQRIPRYELLIKDMLKHTPDGHPDRESLLIAQKEIHKLAIQMNKSEKEAEAADKQDRLLIEIEQMIENLADLCVPKRKFVRQDIVAEIQGATKKDRSIWLFSDLIVCSTRKAKGGAAFRRGSMMNLNMGQDRFVNIDQGFKYKFLWKFPLEDVENLKGNTQISGRHTVDKQLQTFENDMNIIQTMQKQAEMIECEHVQVDDALREIMGYVRRQISEKRQQSLTPSYPPTRIELGISTGDGMKSFLFEFLTDDSKVQFEKQFANAKKSLTTLKNRWEPTFMKAIPISRTRAGMQFSCAASNVDASPDVKEVWVCNTDGYVGQVCFLTLEPEPNQTQCITVCHAKICCIAQVPTWERRLVPAQKLLQDVAKGALAPSPGDPARTIMAWDELDESDEENTESPHSTISSTSSPYSQSPYGTMNGGDDISLPIMSPLIDSPLLRRRFGFGRLDRQLAASQPAISISRTLADSRENMTSPDLMSLPGFGGPKDQNRLSDGSAWQKGSDGSTLHGSLEDLLQEGEAVVGDAQSILAGKDSMWLGTEDGKIHIYPSSQSTRGSKHCVRLAHSAAVHCILYHEGQVFVALSNGDLVIYTRNLTTGEWDFENQRTKSKISSPHAITKMVVVEGKDLWCGCQNLIKIINIKDIVETDHFAVTNDNKRQIYCMVCCGYGVWAALDKRPQIKLYHTVTHDLLADIDVSNPVSKMLASADAIIRQHKAACLRITALLVCNDLLWVGTSAGVVLTLTLPKITPSTSTLAMPVIPQGLAYGHTGHVRFLTCAEIPDKEQNTLSRGGSRRASTTSGKRRSSSSSNASNQSRTISVIISGGDGYEDFRMNSTSESAGRDDSTNHLLVWRA